MNYDGFNGAKIDLGFSSVPLYDLINQLSFNCSEVSGNAHFLNDRLLIGLGSLDISFNVTGLLVGVWSPVISIGFFAYKINTFSPFVVHARR